MVKFLIKAKPKIIIKTALQAHINISDIQNYMNESLYTIKNLNVLINSSIVQ